MIHVAGAMENLVQVCTRCGYVLTDYRGAMVPEGSQPLRGWAEGSNIEIIGHNPKGLWVVDDPPNCKPDVHHARH
jgi:hypothetical protein